MRFAAYGGREPIACVTRRPPRCTPPPAVYEGLLNANGRPDPLTRDLTPEQKKRR